MQGCREEAPGVERRAADPEPTAQLRRLRTGFLLPQDADDQLVCQGDDGLVAVGSCLEG